MNNSTRERIERYVGVLRERVEETLKEISYCYVILDCIKSQSYKCLNYYENDEIGYILNEYCLAGLCSECKFCNEKCFMDKIDDLDSSELYELIDEMFEDEIKEVTSNDS